MEYIGKILTKACEEMTGMCLPSEIVMLILVKHGGLRHPIVSVLFNDRKLGMFTTYERSIRGKADEFLKRRCWCRNHKPGEQWVSGRYLVNKYLIDHSMNWEPLLTKATVCHLGIRDFSQYFKWLHFCGGSDKPPFRDFDVGYRHTDSFEKWPGKSNEAAPLCSCDDLWRIYLSNKDNIPHVFEDQNVEYDEVKLLRTCTRTNLYNIIGHAHGNKRLRFKADDYTSRNEWVRVYYNSLRGEGNELNDWPRKNEC